MGRQLSFAESEFSKGIKKSRKGAFLEIMDKVVPWLAVCNVISEFYAKVPEKEL